MIEDEIGWNTLARYFDGSSDEAMKAVETWMEKDPVRREYVESLRHIWESAGRRRSDWDVDSAWSAVALKSGLDPANMGAPPAFGASEPRGLKRRFSQPMFLRFGVAALMAFVAYLIFAVRFENPVSPQGRMREVATARGERAGIRLTDGSSVTLNSASRIRFPDRFPSDRRELYLEGEAYFDVHPQPGRVFIVRAGNAAVEVLGTAFNVRAWPEDNDVQVVVARGSVSLRDAREKGGGPVVLEKGEMADLNAVGSVSTPRRVDLSRSLDWVDGNLVFDNIPFADVLRRLERQYDLKPTVEDSSILRRRLTARFSNEPLGDILRIMALTLDVRYEVKGTTVVFFLQGKRQQRQ